MSAFSNHNSPAWTFCRHFTCSSVGSVLRRMPRTPRPIAWNASSVEMEFTHKHDAGPVHGVLHVAQHGEGDFRGEVHQNQIRQALGDLFHQGGQRIAGRQQFETLDLAQYGFEAFRQDGFVTIKKNSRHEYSTS